MNTTTVDGHTFQTTTTTSGTYRHRWVGRDTGHDIFALSPDRNMVCFNCGDPIELVEAPAPKTYACSRCGANVGELNAVGLPTSGINHVCPDRDLKAKAIALTLKAAADLDELVHPIAHSTAAADLMDMELAELVELAKGMEAVLRHLNRVMGV